jgi:AIPR protein
MAIQEEVSFESFREQWLAEILEGKPSTVELGHRFARKLVTHWMDVDDTAPDDDLVYCDGSGDGGIDIAYLDRRTDEPEGEDISGDTWYLVQSKYGKAFQGTKTLLEEGQKVIETLDGKRQRLSSLTEGLLERLSAFRKQASERDNIILVFGTERTPTEDEKRVMSDLRAMGRARLGGLFEVDSVSIETIYQRMLEESAKAALRRLKIPLEADLVRSGEELHVGSVSLFGLYSFLKAYRDETEDLDQLYEKNVRRFLGSRGKVNKAMRETLRETPERFGLYNNGITIVVTDISSDGGNKHEVVEPYVVNGCQTTRTIWEVCHQRLESGGTGSSAELDAWRRAVQHGVVVIKIVKVGRDGESLLQAITRYTNSQNAVREKDFLALTSDFRDWARLMGEHYDIFLEIQRGGWDSRKALQKQRPALKQFTREASAFDLLKVYGSGWLREAGLAFGKNPPFLPNGAIFKRIVNTGVEEGDAFGVDDLYAAYLLKCRADSYGFGRGTDKPSRRQTRFLFYMIVIDLLREILTRADITTSHRNLSTALIKLSGNGHENAADALFDTAVETVDSYLTQSDNSIFEEPSYKGEFNFDLNGFLKSEQLGKGGDSCPRLRDLLAVTKMYMAEKRPGQPSRRDVIIGAIKD